MALSLGEWVLIAGVVAIGAFLQNIVGFGLALLVAPVVGIVRPDLMPTAVILVSIPLSLSIAIRGRDSIDWAGLRWSLLPRFPAALLGALLISSVSSSVLGGIVGALVVVACAISAVTLERPVDSRRAAVAGGLSGFMETAAAVGGPPMALLYQHRPASEVRATLAASFLAGKVIALAALALMASGTAFRWGHLGVAAALSPALVVGSLAARPVIGRLGARSIRPAVLLLSTATGLAAVIKSLVG